jgi:cell wall-associated NlpC family hydrolase
VTLADKILAAARACLGTPFRHQGRLPGIALDCAGLICHVCESIGVPYTDERGYSRLPHQGRLQAALDAQESLVRVSDPAPGDVLLFRFRTEPMHIGIYAGETIIHAYEQAGKVCEHRMDDAWRARIVQAYRIVRPDHG